MNAQHSVAMKLFCRSIQNVLQHCVTCDKLKQTKGMSVPVLREQEDKENENDRCAVCGSGG